ncbi:MAG: hypothetical protein SGI97_03645 [candidate division Zixibacteria bacterium]|nr:hypothetical protein [candidate division Zixibacteria bacterium]
MFRLIILGFCSAVVICLVSGSAQSTELRLTPFEMELQKIRFDNAADAYSTGDQLGGDDGAKAGLGGSTPPGYKSPGKAFVLSLLVPGLGQYYAGARIKPFIFFGAEVVTWALYLNYHNDGNKKTDSFEAFNHANFSQKRYSYYLKSAYNTRNEDSLHDEAVKGFSHELPDDTLSQQFFELAGKYDQFAWGWNDASITFAGGTRDLYYFDTTGNRAPQIGDANGVPFSAMRNQYETMRNDANNSYDRATRMIFVSIANHLISGFEAYFSTRGRNKHVALGDDEFSAITIKPKFRTIYTYSDTPYVTVSLKF